MIYDRAKKFGLMDNWQKRLCATGELALLCYRAEYEGILATKESSGVSLLGLQDFPGQGTALVGMMNSHLIPKKGDFARPERFAEFFRPILPLIRLPKYTYTAREQMEFSCVLANYGKETFRSAACLRIYQANSTGKETQRLLFEEMIAEKEYPQGVLTPIGPFCIPMESLVERDVPKTLRLEIHVGPHQSQCKVWVYPEVSVVSPKSVHITASAEEALGLLEKGEAVLLSPPADEAHMPESVQTHFSTDHWTVGTYTYQDGYMGLLTDPKHPALSGFPTDFHADWQWWRINTNARAFILPYGMHSIIEAIDCYARLRNLCFLGEFRVGTGKLMLSGMGLSEKLDYPEVTALYNSILSYMSSDAFEPTQELKPNVLRRLVSP